MPWQATRRRFYVVCVWSLERVGQCWIIQNVPTLGSRERFSSFSYKSGSVGVCILHFGAHCPSVRTRLV